MFPQQRAKRSCSRNLPLISSESLDFWSWGTLRDFALLKEFYRVVKPEGKIYFTMNAFGFYAQRWLENTKRTEGHFSRLNMARIFMNTAMSQKEKGKIFPMDKFLKRKKCVCLWKIAVLKI